ncbi:hypothetical protein CDL12_30032 [Handroanthus impetiginosus]|uniref:Uncharacterized protein n=1 Tax=Handroanthus impetiginosus TaxID=429701 RepID=A0A2G9FWS0_9LAMI|nr:hypothetical protein CDL12_30032 [Handroanthus impetiginosus]
MSSINMCPTSGFMSNGFDSIMYRSISCTLHILLHFNLFTNGRSPHFSVAFTNGSISSYYTTEIKNYAPSIIIKIPPELLHSQPATAKKPKHFSSMPKLYH